MRRCLILALAALTIATAVAVAATPKSGTFKAGKGQVQLGYDLKFSVDQQGRRIKGLVAHVLETCAGSTTSSTTTVAPRSTWAVANGRFSGRKKTSANGVTVYTTLTGRFTSATQATGTIRQESIVAGSRCDTYKLKFTAKRG